MAKETRADRSLREAIESMARQVEAGATYPGRLIAWLERAQDANFELRVRDGMYTLYNRDERRPKTVSLSPWYTSDNDAALESFSWTVTYKEEVTQESNPKFLAKQVALAKLTVEERKLLDL